jgi:hypothetical protein
VNVVLYLCDGVFDGPGELQFRAPEVGGRHKFLLFLRQENPSASSAEAIREAQRFGFGSINVLNGKPLEVESLSSAQGFAKHYEEALAEGSSLVWYPRAADGA